MDSRTESETIILSLVVPMYNEEKTIALFLEAATNVLEDITPDYEIVCVDDGSSDLTMVLLRAAHCKDPRVKAISMSRNFGKDAALTAGIDYARGQAVIPIDADLQDPPELIKELVERWREGFDVVLAVRRDRVTDGFLKRTSARLFYKFMAKTGTVSIPPNVGDFRLIDRRVVDALSLMPERTRFMKGMFAWLGFRQSVVWYSRPARAAGDTKWSFWGLWNFALDGIVSFTSLPLRVWSYIGFACASLAMLYLVFTVVRTLVFGIELPGYASLLSVVLFFNGLIMISLGVLGEYMARMFIEVKGRPLYLVQEEVGISDKEKKSNSGDNMSDIERPSTSNQRA